MVDEISNIKDFDKVLKADVAFVDFFAEWCMPCVMMSPIIDEVASSKSMKGVHFIKVNVDEHGELSQKFGVMSIPTMIIFKKGKEVARLVGGTSAEALEEKIKKFL